jgi:hypothetical protein
MKYEVYLCGDELPTFVYKSRQEAEAKIAELERPEFELHWMDKRIEEVHETNTDNPIDFPT